MNKRELIQALEQSPAPDDTPVVFHTNDNPDLLEVRELFVTNRQKVGDYGFDIVSLGSKIELTKVIELG